MSDDFDALLLVSFGGPQGPAEVIPFLETVLRGRAVPPDRLREVAHHYERFGGVSPINGQNRALIEALRAELATHGPNLPIYWGNRNWHPFLSAAIRDMVRDGVRRALAFVTSAYSSYSGCRQYLEDIERARQEVGPAAPGVEKLRAFYNHPGFVAANVEHLRRALEALPAERRAAAHVAFTAHSIPVAMASGCEYVAQLRDTCELVSTRVGHVGWQLVYQSRSGPPSQPWLEPGIGDHLVELGRGGARDVIVVPIGFVSDHMEVRYDLDIEAREIARGLGLEMVRTPTVGTHPAFVAMIRELIRERTTGTPERRVLGVRGASLDACAPGCCPSGAARLGAGGAVRARTTG